MTTITASPALIAFRVTKDPGLLIGRFMCADLIDLFKQLLEQYNVSQQINNNKHEPVETLPQEYLDNIMVIKELTREVVYNHQMIQFINDSCKHAMIVTDANYDDVQVVCKKCKKWITDQDPVSDYWFCKLCYNTVKDVPDDVSNNDTDEWNLDADGWIVPPSNTDKLEEEEDDDLSDDYDDDDLQYISDSIKRHTQQVNPPAQVSI